MKRQGMAVVLALAPALLALLLVGGGCATAQERRARRMPEVVGALPEADRERLMAGRIAIGDTPEMVRVAWGRPDRRSRILRAEGESEVWTWFDYRSEFVYPAWRPVSPVWRYDRRGRRVFPEIYEPERVLVPVLRGTVEFRDGEVVAVEQPVR